MELGLQCSSPGNLVQPFASSTQRHYTYLSILHRGAWNHGRVYDGTGWGLPACISSLRYPGPRPEYLFEEEAGNIWESIQSVLGYDTPYNPAREAPVYQRSRPSPVERQCTRPQTVILGSIHKRVTCFPLPQYDP